MSGRLITADVAIGTTTMEILNADNEKETVEVPAGVPCLIHEDAGIIWEGYPIPQGEFASYYASEMLKQLQNVMRSTKEWHDVWAATDWTVISSLRDGMNRKEKRRSEAIRRKGPKVGR